MWRHFWLTHNHLVMLGWSGFKPQTRVTADKKTTNLQNNIFNTNFWISWQIQKMFIFDNPNLLIIFNVHYITKDNVKLGCGSKIHLKVTLPLFFSLKDFVFYIKHFSSKNLGPEKWVITEFSFTLLNGGNLI